MEDAGRWLSQFTSLEIGLLVGVVALILAVLTLWGRIAGLNRKLALAGSGDLGGAFKTWEESAERLDELVKEAENSVARGSMVYLQLLWQTAMAWLAALNYEKGLSSLRKLLEECCNFVIRSDVTDQNAIANVMKRALKLYSATVKTGKGTRKPARDFLDKLLTILRPLSESGVGHELRQAIATEKTALADR